jgi:hypothetical protein
LPNENDVVGLLVVAPNVTVLAVDALLPNEKPPGADKKQQSIELNDEL